MYVHFDEFDIVSKAVCFKNIDLAYISKSFSV